MASLERLISPAASVPKRGTWSNFATPAAISQDAELATSFDTAAESKPAIGWKENVWTRTHSYFAIMGGFVFETDSSQMNFMPKGYTRLTLTPLALKKLADLDPMIIPDLSERAIRDRGKADWIAKTLACLQAVWFIIQVIGRAVTSAPISLLEMTAFLHALCCLVVYVVWWHKPLNIEEPEVIKTDTENVRKICAWMIMRSSIGYERRLDSRSYDDRRNWFSAAKEALFKKDAWLAHYTDHEATNPSRASTCSPEYELSQPQALSSSRRSQNPASVILRPGQRLYGFGLGVLPRASDRDDPSLTLDPATLECLRLADSLHMEPKWNPSWGYTIPNQRQMLVSYMPTFGTVYDIDLYDLQGSTALTRGQDSDELFRMFIAAFANIYGLVHLIAWNGPFTTLTQHWMWRAACLIVANTGFFAIRAGRLTVPVFMPLWLPYKMIVNAFPSVRKVFPSWLVQQKFVPLYTCLPLHFIYLAARIYLILECFINISQLPPEVYKIPQWSQYIPHLGAG